MKLWMILFPLEMSKSHTIVISEPKLPVLIWKPALVMVCKYRPRNILPAYTLLLSNSQHADKRHCARHPILRYQAPAVWRSGCHGGDGKTMQWYVGTRGILYSHGVLKRERDRERFMLLLSLL